MLMPIWPVLMAVSFNKMVLACLEICLDTEQELKINIEQGTRNKE
jgi:hypothetical protein